MKKGLLFLIILSCLDLHAVLLPEMKQEKRAFGTQFFQVDPTGTYLDNEFNPPTRVNLSAIDPSLGINAGGTIIKIKRVGGIEHWPPMMGGDDSWRVLLAVFVNSSGDFLAPGEGTTAPSASNIPSFDDPPEDFQVGGGEFVDIVYEVEIPEGAVALLLATDDAYFWDNTDANGNFGIEITYPVLKYEFRHGINVLTDSNEDGFVEILAGAMTSLEVEVGPNIDVTNSEIYWNGNLVDTTPSSNSTGSSRKVMFDLGVIPEILPRSPHLVEVRVWLKDIFNNTVLDQKIFLEARPIEVDIYQVIKNPILYPHVSTAIDLVAGKNMDVVLKLLPNINIGGSSLSLIKEESVSSVPPRSGNADPDAKITFLINPVPNSLEHIGPNTIKLELRDSDNNLFFNREAQVTIRKTKPIKIGFIPISGCWKTGWCFTETTQTQALEMVKDGSSLMNIMYPVADSDFQTVTFTAEPLATPTLFFIPTHAIGQYSGIFDAKAIQRYVEKNPLAYDQKLTYTVGLVQEDYFTRRIDKQGMLGVTFPQKVSDVALVVSYAYSTLSHEIGHLFGLDHNCEGYPPLPIKPEEYCPTEKSTVTGYSNYELPNTIWAYKPPPAPVNRPWIRRDLIINSGYNGGNNATPIYSLMREQSSVSGGEYLQWMAPDEYLEIFKKNLFPSLTSTNIERNVMRISGIVDTHFITTALYVFKSDKAVSGLTGNFVAEVKNVKGELLEKYATSSDDTYGVKTIDFIVNVRSDAEIVELYQVVGQTKHKVGALVLSADILSENLKFVNPNAVKPKLEDFLRNLNKKISEYKQAILDQRLEYSLSVLREINNIIDKELSNVNSRSSGFLFDKTSFQKEVDVSILKVTHLISDVGDSANAFVEVVSKEFDEAGRSKIEINQLRFPENKEHQFIYKAWFDGIPNVIKIENSKKISLSPRASSGEHTWSIQTYIASQKEYNMIVSSLNEYRRLKEIYIKEHDSETDPEKKADLWYNVERSEEKINKLKIMLDNMLKAVGNVVEVKVQK